MPDARDRYWRQQRRQLYEHGVLPTSKLLISQHDTGLILVGLEHHSFVALTPKEARERAALLNMLAGAADSD